MQKNKKESKTKRVQKMTHGGKRKGSGAKPKPEHLKKEKTKPVRIPLSKVDAVYDFIKGITKTIHPMP